MGKVTISSVAPPDERNGLPRMADELMDAPLTLVPVVCLVFVDVTAEQHRKGLKYPKIKIHHIERVTEADREQFTKLLQGAVAERTGAMMLDLGAGDEVPLEDPFPEETEPRDDLASRRG